MMNDGRRANMATDDSTAAELFNEIFHEIDTDGLGEMETDELKTFVLAKLALIFKVTTLRRIRR
eukprot:COSAG04_NODE_17031_length_481_cov_1.054974_1_plen_64_part_00